MVFTVAIVTATIDRLRPPGDLHREAMIRLSRTDLWRARTLGCVLAHAFDRT